MEDPANDRDCRARPLTSAGGGISTDALEADDPAAGADLEHSVKMVRKLTRRRFCMR